jgi:hypothetical protein
MNGENSIASVIQKYARLTDNVFNFVQCAGEATAFLDSLTNGINTRRSIAKQRIYFLQAMHLLINKTKTAETRPVALYSLIDAFLSSLVQHYLDNLEVCINIGVYDDILN